MGSVRALSRRVARLERAYMPRQSPIVLYFGSFDRFVEDHVLPGIAEGKLDRADMVEIVAALRVWDNDGTWDRAHAG